MTSMPTLLIFCALPLIASQNDEREIRYVFAGMQQERAKLWSGSYEIEGIDPTWGPIRATVLFSKDRLRLTKDVKTGANKHVLHACDDGLVIATWNSDQPVCSIRKSNENERQVLYHWDPNSAGFLLLDETNYQKVLKRRFDSWLPTSTVTANGSSRTVVCAGSNEFMEMRVCLSVDCDNGFTPVRNWAEIRYTPKSANPGKVEQNYDVTAKWEQVDNVWVPVHHRDAKGDGSVTSEYRLKWNWVNKKVDDKEFTVDALAVPAGYKMIDFRNSTPENPAGEQIDPETLATQPSLTKYLMYYAGAVLVALAMGWYWLRKPLAA